MRCVCAKAALVAAAVAALLCLHSLVLKSRRCSRCDYFKIYCAATCTADMLPALVYTAVHVHILYEHITRPSSFLCVHYPTILYCT
jgi:hypothetical protein